MAYTLGGTTLPQPKKLKRQFVEVAESNATITGITTRKIVARKEIFTLTFQHLTQAQASTLMSLYEQEAVLSFVSTETNLPISATDVLVDLPERNYPKSGREWREDFVIVLTEVK